MAEIWINIGLSIAAFVFMLMLHALLVMSEISLVKFRYRKPNEEQLSDIKQLPGLAKLIDNSAQTGRIVRFSKTLCTVASGLLLVPIVNGLLILLGLKAFLESWIMVLSSIVVAV